MPASPGISRLLFLQRILESFKRYFLNKPSVKEPAELRPKTHKKIAQLKSLMDVQEKIQSFIESPVNLKVLEDSFGDTIDPEYYSKVKYYFERIPQLRPFRPLNSNKYRKDQAKLAKLMKDYSTLQSDLKDWTFLPFSEHSTLN